MSRIEPAKSTALFPASVFMDKANETEHVPDSCVTCRYFLEDDDEPEDEPEDEPDDDDDDDDGEEDDEPDDDDDEPEVQTKFGYCRRYPPQVNPRASRIGMSEFPVVTELDWCGEFVPRL